MFQKSTNTRINFVKNFFNLLKIKDVKFINVPMKNLIIKYSIHLTLA